MEMHPPPAPPRRGVRQPTLTPDLSQGLMILF